jgi:AhpD family alkylhydroperoxidase
MSKEYFYKKKRPDVSKYFNKEAIEAFRTFNQLALKQGFLSAKTKELIAVACAHITQCPYCIKGHMRKATKLGVTKQELAEAILVAIALNAGSSSAHSHFALENDVET